VTSIYTCIYVYLYIVHIFGKWRSVAWYMYNRSWKTLTLSQYPTRSHIPRPHDINCTSCHIKWHFNINLWTQSYQFCCIFVECSQIKPSIIGPRLVVPWKPCLPFTPVRKFSAIYHGLDNFAVFTPRLFGSIEQAAVCGQSQVTKHGGNSRNYRRHALTQRQTDRARL
jgi:hypothetical protein